MRTAVAQSPGDRRRGARSPVRPVGHDVTVAEEKPGRAAEADGTGTAPEGLSQFMAKVLDQLSLSAWLPAAMLVGCTAIVLQLRSQRNFDVGAAVLALTAKPLGIIVVLLFALVLAAMVSQAFSFGAIRFLEGYWGPLLRLGVFGALVRVKARKLARLRARQDALESQAFLAALTPMLGKEEAHIVLIHIQREFYGGPDTRWTEEELADAPPGSWEADIPAAHSEKLASTIKKINDFPPPNRLRPTKLGNIIRATEETLHRENGEDLQGFVLRRRALITPRLELHHDQFRTRLDMYCTLVVIFAFLAAFSAILFATAQMPFLGAVIVVAIFVVMAMVSYSAAIASARGYSLTLRQIDELYVNRQEPSS